MEKDDEEAVDVSMNVVKYPIMPSLVALQIMRNRLHLALLGKKLMKWTALATGKELRRLSQEVASLLGDYGKRCTDAYMQLARCRYQMPMMNHIVKECCPTTARVTVEMTARSVAGVKVINLGVQETGPDGFALLGLGRSGEIIQETKRVWYELLKVMVARASFLVKFRMIDDANKSATKKQNVLKRLIVPKIDITMKYVTAELDEMEREETFRLKRFKASKYKIEKKKQEKDVKEEVKLEVFVEPTRELESEPESKPEPDLELKPEPEPEPKSEPEPKPKLEPKPVAKVPVLVQVPQTPPRTPPQLAEELIIEHMSEVLRLAEKIQNAALIQESFGLTRCDLGKLKVQMHESLELSKTSKKTRECVKCPGSECHCPASLNSHIQPSVSLSLEIPRPRPPYYEPALKIMPTTKVTTPMPEYIFSRCNCQKPEPRIEVSERSSYLQNHVDKVVCLTHSQDEALSKSIEDCINCCLDVVKTKIDDINERKIVSAKISHLKMEIEHLEHNITNLTTEGLASERIRSFMSRCKDFKNKLEFRSASKTCSVCSTEKKFVEQINVGIELSKKAKMEGLVSDSVEEFISTCKELKTKIDTQEDEKTKPKVINDLLCNLNEIMKCISQYKQNGLLSESMEKFYTTCKRTKAKLVTKKYEICPSCQELGDNLQISSKLDRTCEKIFSSKKEWDDESCKCLLLHESASDLAGTTCKKGFSHKGEPEDDFCKCDPLQESAVDPAGTTCKKNVSPTEVSKDDSCICNPLQESTPNPAGTACTVSVSPKRETEDGFCKCNPMQESAPDPPDTCSCDTDKGYEDGPLYIIGPEIPAFKAKGSKTSQGDDHTRTSISGPNPSIYTAVLQIPKSASCFSKSSCSKSYVPAFNLSTCTQMIAQPPLNTCMQIQMQACESFQTIALDKNKCKECDANSFKTFALDKTKCKERVTNSFETFALDTNKCKECHGNSFETTDLDKTKCKECDANSFQTFALDKTKNKECHGNSFETTTLDKTKCEFKNAVNSRGSNSVPMESGSREPVKSTKRGCNAPTTKGSVQIVRNIKSEKLIRTFDLTDPILPGLWSLTSAETLSSRNRNNDSDSAQMDPFF